MSPRPSPRPYPAEAKRPGNSIDMPSEHRRQLGGADQAAYQVRREYATTFTTARIELKRAETLAALIWSSPPLWIRVERELTARTQVQTRPPPSTGGDPDGFHRTRRGPHLIRGQEHPAFCPVVVPLRQAADWAVTGTPVRNKLEDLAALLAFSRVTPFDERSKFLQYIYRAFKNADPGLPRKLRVLIAGPSPSGA